MMKKSSKNYDSPRKGHDSGSESEQMASNLRMVAISSPGEGLSPRKRTLTRGEESLPGNGSPQKRGSSRLAALSPLKGSPLKRNSDLKEDECSPRKRISSRLDFSPSKNSPQKNFSAVGSPRKNLMNPECPVSSFTALKSPKKTDLVTVSSPSKRERQSTSNNSVFHEAVTEVQQILRTRISQINSPPSICGYEKERKQLHDLIKRTAMTGESNSMLLIGPRGCGKSMLIQDVLKGLYQEEKIKADLLLVKLNGLLQSDDRIALREITRQLQLENTVGDKVFGSFAETLQFLLEALKKGDQSSKPILFVLEEFDLFAQHKNQTLLYNLFDISQSAQAPICVIGVTCRLDVVELLEKRVKSRFSHRQIYLFNKLTLDQYRRLCKDYLSLPDSIRDKTFAKNWNSNIQSLLDEVAVKDVLERQYSLMNDVRGLLSLLTFPVCNISAAHPTITATDLITSFKLISTDTKSALLHGVSILELAIIIAMKHLTDIYEGEPFNFEMVYSEYLKFARHRSGMQVYEKAIVMKAYEHLQTLELIRGHGGGGASQKEYKLMDLLVHPAQIIDALQKYPNCPTEMKQWASQSIS